MATGAPIKKCHLKTTLKNRYVANTEWPSNSPDCNPLDYYFWNDVSCKVYQGRHSKPFTSMDELKARIVEVWDECASNRCSIRKAIKQFFPRLHGEQREEKQGRSIKKIRVRKTLYKTNSTNSLFLFSLLVFGKKIKLLI